MVRGNLESGQRTDAINEEDHDQVDKGDVEHDTEKCAKDVTMIITTMIRKITPSKFKDDDESV